MQHQFQIRTNRLVASVSLLGALLATSVISAGVVTLADSSPQQDNTPIVVTATRLAPATANTALARRAAAGSATECRAIVC